MNKLYSSKVGSDGRYLKVLWRYLESNKKRSLIKNILLFVYFAYNTRDVKSLKMLSKESYSGRRSISINQKLTTQFH